MDVWIASTTTLHCFCRAAEILACNISNKKENFLLSILLKLIEKYALTNQESAREVNSSTLQT